jgi:hypothetical protein
MVVVALTAAVASEDEITKVNDFVKVLWLHAVRRRIRILWHRQPHASQCRRKRRRHGK